MEDYFCPLCKQEVSKQLFEKITGIWQEKEKHLRDLKQKEKVLLQKEKELLIKVESEKKKFVEEVKKKHTKEMEKKTNEFRLILDKEKKQIIKEKEKIKLSINSVMLCYMPKEVYMILIKKLYQMPKRLK